MKWLYKSLVAKVLKLGLRHSHLVGDTGGGVNALAREILTTRGRPTMLDNGVVQASGIGVKPAGDMQGVVAGGIGIPKLKQGMRQFVAVIDHYNVQRNYIFDGMSNNTDEMNGTVMVRGVRLSATKGLTSNPHQGPALKKDEIEVGRNLQPVQAGCSEDKSGVIMIDKVIDECMKFPLQIKEFLVTDSIVGENVVSNQAEKRDCARYNGRDRLGDEVDDGGVEKPLRNHAIVDFEVGQRNGSVGSLTTGVWIDATKPAPSIKGFQGESKLANEAAGALGIKMSWLPNGIKHLMPNEIARTISSLLRDFNLKQIARTHANLVPANRFETTTQSNTCVPLPVGATNMQATPMKFGNSSLSTPGQINQTIHNTHNNWLTNAMPVLITTSLFQGYPN